MEQSQKSGGRGGGAAVPGRKFDLLPRLKERYGMGISEKRLMTMLAEDAARGEGAVNNVGTDDDFDPIEGARAGRNIDGPPMAIAFKSFVDGAGGDAQDDDYFPIVKSPSSLSWHTFKERGKPNKSPFVDAEVQQQSAAGEAATALAVRKLNDATKPVWDEPVFEKRDIFERNQSFNEEYEGVNKGTIANVPAENAKKGEINEEIGASEDISGKEVSKIESKKGESNLQDTEKEEEARFQDNASHKSKARRKKTKPRDKASNEEETVTTSDDAKARKKKTESHDKTSKEEMKMANTNEEHQSESAPGKPKPQKESARDEVKVTPTSKEHEPSVHSRNYSAAEERGYATEPESRSARKKEKAGFGFSSILRKKTRRKKGESSKIAQAAAVTSDDEDGNRALLHSYNAPDSSSPPSKEKGSLNPLQRVFKLGKSRHSKGSANTVATKAYKESKNIAKIEEEEQAPEEPSRPPIDGVPSTPVKQSSVANNTHHPSSSATSSLVDDKDAIKGREKSAAPIPIATPIKKTRSNVVTAQERRTSPVLATIIVTPIKEAASAHGLSGKPKGEGSPTADDTPTTVGTATSSDWGRSPHSRDIVLRMAPTPVSARSRSCPQSVASGHLVMLPPEMPPSMVSCKNGTMEEEEEGQPTGGPVATVYRTASAGGSASGEVSIDRQLSSNTTSKKEDPPSNKAAEPEGETEKGYDPPGATFQQALSWGVLSSVLSEEGYENPSTYTIPNPMSDRWPTEPIAEGGDDAQEGAQGGGNGDEQEDPKAEGDDNSKMLAYHPNDAANDGGADDEDDPSIFISYNNGSNVIGTSADVFVEVSSTAHTEAYHDIEVVKCIGLEDINAENNQSKDDVNGNNDEEERGEGGVLLRQDSKMSKNSKASKASKTSSAAKTAKTAKTEESDEKTKASERTHGTQVPLRAFLEATSKPRETSRTAPRSPIKHRSEPRETTLKAAAPFPLVKQRSSGQKSTRGRLGRSRIRAAAGAVMSVRNVAEHRSKSRDRRARSKSRDRKMHRSKSRDSKRINIGERLGLKKRQSSGVEAKKEEKNEKGEVDDGAASTGLSNAAREVVKQDFVDTPSSLKEGMDNLVIIPAVSPVLGNNSRNGHHGLSREARAALKAKSEWRKKCGLSQDASDELEREDDMEETLEEIEVAFDGASEKQRDKNEIRKSSKKRREVRSRSRLSRAYYSNSEDEIETGDSECYSTPGDDDSSYDREDSSEETDDDFVGGYSSSSFVSKNANSGYHSFLGEDDTEYTPDKGCRTDSNCRDNCTAFEAFEPFGIPQEEIYEDLRDAFEDTIGVHITQMIKSFDITEGLVGEARELRKDACRTNGRSSSARKRRGTGVEARKGKNKRSGKGVRSNTGERDQRQSLRLLNHPHGEKSQEQIRGGKQEHQHRGGGSNSRRVEATKNRIVQNKRTSSFRRMEL